MLGADFDENKYPPTPVHLRQELHMGRTPVCTWHSRVLTFHLVSLLHLQLASLVLLWIKDFSSVEQSYCSAQPQLWYAAVARFGILSPTIISP